MSEYSVTFEVDIRIEAESWEAANALIDSDWDSLVDRAREVLPESHVELFEIVKMGV